MLSSRFWGDDRRLTIDPIPPIHQSGLVTVQGSVADPNMLPHLYLFSRDHGDGVPDEQRFWADTRPVLDRTERRTGRWTARIWLNKDDESQVLVYRLTESGKIVVAQTDRMSKLSQAAIKLVNDENGSKALENPHWIDGAPPRDWSLCDSTVYYPPPPATAEAPTDASRSE